MDRLTGVSGVPHPTSSVRVVCQVLVHSNERWGAVPPASVSVPPSTLARAQDLLVRGQEARLVDFEYHLENAHEDWDNAIFA